MSNIRKNYFKDVGIYFAKGLMIHAPRSMLLDNQGQILAEIILAVGIVAMIGLMVAQVMVISTRVSSSSNDRLVQLRLAEEAVETLRAISQGNDANSQGWNRIYKPPDGTGDAMNAKGAVNPYKIVQSGGVWILQSGGETISLSGKTYERKIIIENVCRDDASSVIMTTAGLPPCTSGNSDDPATQKVTVTVHATSSPLVSLTFYLTRYLNEGSKQTNWNGGVNAGPFGATSTVTNVASSQTMDLGNSNCDVSATCMRLQAQ